MLHMARRLLIKRGPEHPQWKGGRRMVNGYVSISTPGHPRADAIHGHVYEHILVAERALGHSLPPQAVIHHVNEITSDNRPSNLVICQDQTYHMLLHIRLRALKACGNAEFRKCTICQVYDDPNNLHITKRVVVHRQCRREYGARYALLRRKGKVTQ